MGEDVAMDMDIVRHGNQAMAVRDQGCSSQLSTQALV